MDQLTASTDHRRDQFAVSVSAPHSWDGIGQALRAAYRDHREPPVDMAETLRLMNDLD